MESLKKELEAIDTNAVRGVEEKKRLREQCEEKVKKNYLKKRTFGARSTTHRATEV